MKKIITDYDIQAYLDNELDRKNREYISSYIRHNAWAQKRLKELQNQKEMLKIWWHHEKTH